ncbi:Protein of unknown function [Solimonas aquatica]|uniref:DUF2934 domain-containing protein n=1 Tax=Solimonas aquatica TaxID=489703 RepID=A0A1H9A5B6_9GAMM|nr:DUF2934 domain-containing protein [Solimonas aquatica]SEP71711.1 Protein of unknown function [Solimonas aquatica]
MSTPLSDDPQPSTVLANLAAAHKAWSRPDAQHKRMMIEQIAYAMAMRRGFAPGKELQDWLAAEAEVEDILKGEGFCGD